MGRKQNRKIKMTNIVMFFVHDKRCVIGKMHEKLSEDEGKNIIETDAWQM